MQVRVWNDNTHNYTENFKEQLIKIPAKSYIMMDEGEAQLFRGSFAPIQLDGDGNPVANGFKMIRIEAAENEKPEPVVNKLICQACGYEASSEKDLAEHCAANHKEQLLVDPVAEAAAKARRKK